MKPCYNAAGLAGCVGVRQLTSIAPCRSHHIMLLWLVFLRVSDLPCDYCFMVSSPTVLRDGSLGYLGRQMPWINTETHFPSSHTARANPVLLDPKVITCSHQVGHRSGAQWTHVDRCAEPSLDWGQLRWWEEHWAESWEACIPDITITWLQEPQ